MERLKGMDALGVVFKRVSDGCEVIHCMLEFYKEMADVERSYALRISRLCQSTNYTFHSNILSQWLGSEPFEEIGTLKYCWQNLGNELLKLASLHDEKAESFHDEVRQPLLDILPELNEDRKELRQRKLDLENDMKNANRRFQKIQKNYFKLGDTLTQLRTPSTGGVKFPWSQQSHDKKLNDIEKEFKEQETLYMESYRDVVEVHQSLNDSVNGLLTEMNQKELKRVNTVAKSLQEFARTLSNTVPVYLESMKRIVLSVDEISGEDDISSFVSSYSSLHQIPDVPRLEYHHLSACSGQLSSTDKGNTVKTEMATGSHQVAQAKPLVKPSVLPKPKDIDSLSISLSNSDNPIQKPSPSPQRTKTITAHSTNPPIQKKRSTTDPSQRPDAIPKPKHIPVVKIVGTDPSKNNTRSREDVSEVRKKPVRPKTDIANGSKDELLQRLRTMAQANDYYSLLGVTSDASREELSRARRELTAKLHPDHFTGNPEQQTRASEQLVIVNQAFHDVLNKEESKKLYDQICRFREKYHLIVRQERRGLESAKVRLSSLHSNMKRARCPLPLLNELQLSLQLIDLSLEEAS